MSNSSSPSSLDQAALEGADDEAVTARARPRSRVPFAGNRKATLGLVILGVYLLLAIVGPWLAPFDPDARSADLLMPPSSTHWLGTTHLGQDLLSQLLVGTRGVMVVGLSAGILATILSVLIGVSAGYLGGVWDDVLSALSNVFLVIPALPLIIIVASTFVSAGAVIVAATIGFTSWAWGARVLRAQTLSLRRRDYIEAARASGESTWRIVLFEILPNLTAIIASSFVGTVIFAVTTEITLAFIGIGGISDWNWGEILFWAQSQQALAQGAWWWFVPAGLAIAFLGTALALLNFGIDEFVSPRLRSAGKSKVKTADGRTVRMRVGFTPVLDSAAAAANAAPSAHSLRTAAGSGPTHTPPSNQPPSSKQPVLEIRHLHVDYGLGDEAVHAVRDVQLTLHRGEVLGLAGESGSGKSTLAYGLTRLLAPPGAVASGEVIYHPAQGAPYDVLKLSDSELRKFRWAETAIVFQGAMNSLNPVHKVATQLHDVLRAHEPELSPESRDARCREMLKLVGISADRMDAYPHQLSGGMRQRVMIAMALILRPQVVIMDEPTTALDVVMQRQILGQLVELRERLGFSVIFITHDLSLLVEFSDRIAIMYGGQIVEEAPAATLYRDSLHPYSAGLLSSFPALRGPRRELSGIPGSPPDLKGMPGGCSFHPRCSRAFGPCRTDTPVLGQPDTADGASRSVACWLHPAAGSVDADAASGAPIPGELVPLRLSHPSSSPGEP